jgi:hypothetical protein
MKLSRFDSVTLAEAGVEFKLIDPVSKADTGASITLLGADSKTYKTKQKEIQERHRLAGKQISASDAEADAVEIMAACVKSWKGLQNEDGTYFVCSFENAKALFVGYPELYERCAVFAMTRANFFAPASES